MLRNRSAQVYWNQICQKYSLLEEARFMTTLEQPELLLFISISHTTVPQEDLEVLRPHFLAIRTIHMVVIGNSITETFTGTSPSQRGQELLVFLLLRRLTMTPAQPHCTASPVFPVQTTSGKDLYYAVERVPIIIRRLLLYMFLVFSPVLSYTILRLESRHSPPYVPSISEFLQSTSPCRRRLRP